MKIEIFDLDPDRYEPHPVHAGNRHWSETNCWLDMMVEVLHCLGFEPLAAGAFTLSTDFEAEQWTLFKFPPEDLRELFGLEVAEMYVWRPVLDHVVEQLRHGRLVTVEVDAFHLPDTAGVTYGTDHAKTGIVVQMVDPECRHLGYFHNAGYFELGGADFDGIFGLDPSRPTGALLPYMETVRLDRLRHLPDADEVALAEDLTRRHLARRPLTNPVGRLAERLRDDLGWLAAAGDAGFHPYAFATCRQLGATAELAASYVRWLCARTDDTVAAAADDFDAVAAGAKSLQFTLARVARGRTVDLDGPLAELAEAWDRALVPLVARYGA